MQSECEMYPAATYLIALTFCLIAYTWYRRLRDPLRRIPGPPGLPILGQALSFDFTSLHRLFDEWSHCYGPVMRIKLFGQDIVVLSSIDVVREALITRGTDFAGRPQAYRSVRVTYGKDIAFQNFSNTLVMMRKMALKALRSYGDGISRLEAILTEAANEFVADLGTKGGEPMDIDKETHLFVSNVMATIVYGEKMAPGDTAVQLVSELNDSIQTVCDPLSTGSELDVMPWLRHTFLSRSGMALVEKAERLRSVVIEKKLLEAEETLDPAQPRGCLDQFLLAQKRECEEAGRPVLDSQHVTALCMNLIAGGTKTTHTALSAVYLLLLHHPDVQEKLQKEIDSIVGQARTPTLKDTEQMPYLQAFILEMLRYVSIVPSSPKATMVDTYVGGYAIPANTWVFVNNWSVHHNPAVYSKPFEFRPERFLDDCGALLPHDHPVRASFIAFGLGRRVCIGENFARSRLLLLLDEWSHHYGPVMRFTLLGQDIVVLSDINVVREALITRGTDFAGRPPAWRAQRVTYGKDIAFQNFGSALVGLRKLAQKALKSYGDGMSRLESVFTEAATEFVDEIGRKDDQPIEIDKDTYNFVCNVMATIVYGEKVAAGDNLVHLVSELNDSFQEACDPVSTGKELDVMPWLRHTFLSRQGMALVEKAERLRAEVIEQRLKAAQDTLDPAHPRGCLDQFLISQTSDYDEAGKPMWDSEHVTALCINLISGGTKTTYTAMCAVYLLLVHYPEVQRKLQNEIDAAVGRARAPTLKDIEQLPYSQAFVLEVLRFIPVLPISPPRMTIVDAIVGGYAIPANTRVFINNWSVLHNPAVYPKPFDFKPERFLDDNGALLPHDHSVRTSFVAFGLGRRVCIGENFARTRLVLLLTTLLQRYTIIKDDSRPFPDADPRNFDLQLLLGVPKCSVRALLRS